MAAPAVPVDLCDWMSRNRLAAPILAFASGLVGGPLYIGAAVTGWIIGRAGVGRAATIGAFVAVGVGFAVAMIAMIQSSLKTCPSCVDAYIVAPFAVPLIVAPFTIGIWVGRRSRRRLNQTAG